MHRRAVLGAAATTFGVGLVGCLGDDTNHYTVRGVDVPLVAVADAIEWYEAGDTTFLDARPNREHYEELRIEDAEFSPEPDGLPEDDPAAALDLDDRIVTYCVCPHAQAGSRAATLIEEDYTAVYALDEGLEEWYEQGHPIAGSGEEVLGHY